MAIRGISRVYEPSSPGRTLSVPSSGKHGRHNVAFSVAGMALDPRAPVIVGVGQVSQHTDDLDEALDPSLLICSAIGDATVDAGLRSIPNPQSIRVVNLLTWRYGDPAYLIAQQLGLSPEETAYTTMGGQSPQALVNATADEIVAGQLDLAILAGGEA